MKNKVEINETPQKDKAEIKEQHKVVTDDEWKVLT